MIDDNGIKKMHILLFIIVIGAVSYFLFRFHRASIKHSAVQNAFLAKYTSDLMPRDLREQVHDRTLQIMKRMGLLEEQFWEMSPMLQFSFYALAMAELRIPPSLPGENWHYVKNPYMALHQSEHEVQVVKCHLKNTHGVEIDLQYFDHLFGPNHKNNDINSSKNYEEQNDDNEMNKFTNDLISKLTSAEKNQDKDIGIKEFGEKYCFLILDKTSEYFADHQLMENLGIKISNVAVREVHILIMFSIFNSIKDLRLNGNIKSLMMDEIIGSYLDLLIEYTKAKGLDEEMLLNDSDKLTKLIFKRFAQYTEILKKYTDDVYGENSSGGSCNEFDRGNDLIKVLNHITSYDPDDENGFPSVSFFLFFIKLTMDEQIRNSIKFDVSNSTFAHG